jgi:pre-rRNA-processing protein TSR4
MVLLLQLNGDLPESFPGHERRLYVLTCRRKTCRRRDGSVRVLRGVRISESEAKDRRKATGEAVSKPASSQTQQKVVTSKNIGESLFGVKPAGSSSSSDPFSTSKSSTTTTSPFNSFSASSTNPFSTSQPPSLSELAAKPAQGPISVADLPKSFASAVSLNSPPLTYGPVPPPEPWPQDSDFPPPYPLYYLVDADYETLDKISNEASIPRQTMDIDEEGGSSSQKEDKAAYEDTIDKTFQKFADRLAQNPEQVIRYEFKGQPLLYSKSDAVGKLLAASNTQIAMVAVAQGPGGGRMPRCENCGAERVFEVQLTPHAITELEAEDLSLEGMEWGTIIVGVCEKDCSPRGTDLGRVGYAEEWAGVQWEEVKEKR